MKPTLIPFTVNEQNCMAPSGSTILQACEYVGIMIPRFCYHDRLSIAGNCRMCLIQLDKAVKPIASCAMELAPGMKIFTNTLSVKKAREGVMEFLLANHPLDCPICDQGGECDLQDQSLLFGNDRGRFYETKRSVSDKSWGLFVKTVMTRCIHCTRCQRFSTELSGAQEISMVGRGQSSEITNFLSNPILSEVSANVIDLCPVGALTSKPYAFTARPWELKKFNSLDLTDTMGSNLSFHTHFQKVLRIVPLLNQEINQEWASDRARFHYDGYRLQRLMTPLLGTTEEIRKIDWGSAYSDFFLNVGPFFSVGYSFGELSLEDAFSLKNFLSFSSDASTSSYSTFDNRSSYSFDGGFSNISKCDLIVIVGLELKRELPLFLVRIRDEQNKRDLKVLTFGFDNSGLSSLNVGSSVDFKLFLKGKTLPALAWKKATHPLLILSDSSTRCHQVRGILKKFNPNTKVAFVAKAGKSYHNCFEFGINTACGSDGSNVLINTDFHPESYSNATCFYFGSNGPSLRNGAQTYMLPISSSIERSSHHISGEGRLQRASAVFSHKNRNTSEVLKLMTFIMPIDSDLQNQDVTLFSDLELNALPLDSLVLSFPPAVHVEENTPCTAPESSVYITNPLTRSSRLLSQAALLEQQGLTNSFLTL